jgi:hypothetical protein
LELRCLQWVGSCHYANGSFGWKADISCNSIFRMGRSSRALWFVALALCSSSAAAGRERCSTVHARYAVSVENDYLQVRGSNHHLVVVIAALDKALEARGWERTAAWGDFVVCSKGPVDPLQLSNRDAVRVKTYSHIRFVRRD